MQEQITKVKLENGLSVLLKEIHTAPLVSAWMWYRVGSRNEVPGRTGASHWVEHMLFKGTPTYPAGTLDKAISRLGGYWNAMTYLDWTTYFATMPAPSIDLILKVEADRLTNSLFNPHDVESERTVIISERKGNENDPSFLLDEEIQAAAFRVHPYHHQVIGDMADLENMTRDTLYQHYRSYYQPANAVLTLAGAFESEKMLARIRELYSDIPSAPLPPEPNRPEPEPRGERRVLCQGPGETTFIEATYLAPAGAQDDFFTLLVLDSLLTGPSNLNMFSGGISNKTSRLYQKMVETEIAIGLVGSVQATIDPYLYQIVVTLHPDHTPYEVITTLDTEIARLQDELPDPADLARAVKQARALFAYGSESITNQAFWLGFAEMFDSYDWFTTYLDRLAQVKPEDIQRLARQMLRPDRRIMGTYRPQNSGRDA